MKNWILTNLTWLALLVGTSVDAQVKQTIAEAPLKIPFTLKESGYVTLVIEDNNGIRVRNLISETWFEAGKQVVFWDGLDDLGRDVGAARHGFYNIPSKLVSPGRYTVRGLVHAGIKPLYEFSVYATGTPPWSTNDHTGGWLGNHSAPQAAVFVPAKQSPTKEPVVFLGSYVTEGPDGLAWVNLDGKKMGGKVWVGGVWTAAPFMARDAGEKADPEISVYVGSVWSKSGQGELRLNSLSAKGDKNILLHPLGEIPSNEERLLQIGGLAVYNGTGVVSLTKKNQLLFFDVKAGKVLATKDLNAPMGLTFDNLGRLLVLSGDKLIRFDDISDANRLPSPKTVISSKLEAPVGITVDANQIYVSDGGKSHQVKVFTADGKFVRAIGNPGVPKVGPYDPLHMNNPAGIAVDSKQQLWVTENDYLPKRVSVWSLDGKLIRAFYGPSKYGGGGALDPIDKDKFYYAEENRGAMEFKLDWKTGESKLQQVLYRKIAGSLEMPTRGSAPETPLYYKGKRYFTNCYNSSPASGLAVAFIFTERDGVAFPAAAMGRADNWDVLGKDKKDQRFFIWSDLNGDAQVQDEEVTFQPGVANGVTVMDDLSFCITQLNGKAVQFLPTSFTAKGVPIYDLKRNKVLAEGVQVPGSSGGNQVLPSPEGWTVVTQGVSPFAQYSLSGVKDGKPVWSYPNLWPGLHASQEAPLPDFPGQLIGPTRLLGGILPNKGTDAGSLWAINSNHGMVYLFTYDGLFVSTLFQPMRTGKRWNMNTAERGMNLKDYSLSEENFWPTITQTETGEVYMVDGGRSSLVKIDGLKSIKRIPGINIDVTKEDLEKCTVFQLNNEMLRQKSQGTGILNVPTLANEIVVDGKWDDWKGVEWANIDTRGVKPNFNKAKAYNVTGAVAVSGNRLYIGYKTNDASLLKNSGEVALAPFKTGGALDVMIGADGQANADRQGPVEGDLRLLVTIIKGSPKAILYQAVVKGTKPDAQVPFSSPWRTVIFDQVKDVTSQLQFAADKDGSYEISMPLAVLGLKPTAGLKIKGDLGILRGDGSQTLSRVYWNNKATAIVSDVPSEAELRPRLWGTWLFK